jgi:GNAT superfamily N-acetyltransferase
MADCYGRPMDRAALARLEHENMIAADLLAASQVPGAVVRRADGLAVFATGLPLRLFNQVAIDDPAAVTPGAIAAAVAELRARGDRFVVNLRAGIDDVHVPVVLDLGLQRHSPEPWMPGMTLHPLPPAGRTPTPAALVIRRVTDPTGVADHRAAAAGGFDMPGEWLESLITEEMATHPDAAVYVGYVDDGPVVAGLGIRSGRTIGVYDIATLPDVRGRGYGAAMTMRVVDDGAAAGCDVASLQASEMGRPLYERLGFRTVVEYVGYVDP